MKIENFQYEEEQDLIDIVNQDIKNYMLENNFNNYNHSCLYLDYCTGIFKKNKDILLDKYIKRISNNQLNDYDKHLNGLIMIEKSLSDLIDIESRKKIVTLKNRPTEEMGILSEWVLWQMDEDEKDYIAMVTVEGEEVIKNWLIYELIKTQH